MAFFFYATVRRFGLFDRVIQFFVKGLDMQTIGIDGTWHSGNYRVSCECGAAWSGEGELTNTAYHSPALPIAEAVVHMKRVHGDELWDFMFSPRMQTWLSHYFDAHSMAWAKVGFQSLMPGTPRMSDQ